MSAATSIAAELLTDERLVALVDRALEAERNALSVVRLASPEQMTDDAVREMDRRRNAIHVARGEQRQAYELIGERLRLLIAEAVRRAS